MSNNVNTNHLVRTLILFVVLIAGFFVYSKFFKETILPISETVICVYPVINKNNSQIGVASYWSGNAWITAQHVLEDCGVNCSMQIKNYNNLNKDLNLNITNKLDLGNDRGVFQIVSSGGFTTVNCATNNDGLVTYVSGIQQKIPVNITGIYLSYQPDFGQSGSPIFENGKLIGIVSKKGTSGGVLSLIP